MSYVAYESLSELARRMQPFETGDEHGGYTVEGHDDPDEALLAAALEHDLHLVGEPLEGGYTVERGYGTWEPYVPADPDDMRLRWQTEPAEDLEPMTIVEYDWTLSGGTA